MVKSALFKFEILGLIVNRLTAVTSIPVAIPRF